MTTKNWSEHVIADRWEELDDEPGDIVVARVEPSWIPFDMKPTKTGFLEYYFNPLGTEIDFYDDRGNHFDCALTDLHRPNAVVFPNGGWWQWQIVDKLRREIRFADNRGVEFRINVEKMRRECHDRINFCIPKQDPAMEVFRGQRTKRGPRPMLNINDPILSTNKEAQMGGTSNASVGAKEEPPIPSRMRAPQLDVYFTINGLPQEFTEKEVNEHVAKLLKLGQHVVTIKRVIVDAATQNTLQNGREITY
jgi:hypothetical protein